MTRTYVFGKSLPRKLFEWVMRDPDAQISEVVSEKGVNATRDVLLSPAFKA